MIDIIRSKFGYEHWANARALESLRTLPSPAEKPQRCLGHIVIAHQFWFRRLHNEPPPQVDSMFPLHTLEELAQQVDDVRHMWADYIEGITVEKLASQVFYLTTKGKPFESSVCDILLHVTNHSTYHRGQIAAFVRESGGEPLPTDYIIYTRGG